MFWIVLVNFSEFFSRNTFVLVVDSTDVFKVINKRIFETDKKIKKKLSKSVLIMSRLFII